MKTRKRMYATGNKKMLNMLILEILQVYSDEEHSLTQQEIIRLLKKHYGMVCDRRSVKNNVMSLIEMGYDISVENGYKLLSREFDDAELRILIDSVLFSKSISNRRRKKLIEKLKSLSSCYFDDKSPHSKHTPDMEEAINNQAIYALDAINDAIAAKKKIEFIYNEVGTDFKLHPKREEPYKVSPYEIVVNNGRFYLICNYDKYDDIAHFRIDKMMGVNTLDEPIKPTSKVKELKNGFELSEHMTEHFYMYGGESIYAKIKALADMMSELTDWFGMGFKIIENNGDNIIIRVKCNYSALRFWALQYGLYAEVLEPENLREQLKQDIVDMGKKYGLKVL